MCEYEKLRERNIKELSAKLVEWKAYHQEYKEEIGLSKPKMGKKSRKKLLVEASRKSERLANTEFKWGNDSKRIVKRQKKRKILPSSEDFLDRKKMAKLRYVDSDNASAIVDLDVFSSPAAAPCQSEICPAVVPCQSECFPVAALCQSQKISEVATGADLNHIVPEAESPLCTVCTEACMQTPSKKNLDSKETDSVIGEDEARNLSTAAHLYSEEVHGSLVWLSKNKLTTKVFEEILAFAGKG